MTSQGKSEAFVDLIEKIHNNLKEFFSVKQNFQESLESKLRKFQVIPSYMVEFNESPEQQKDFFK